MHTLVQTFKLSTECEEITISCVYVFCHSDNYVVISFHGALSNFGVKMVNVLLRCYFSFFSILFLSLSTAILSILGNAAVLVSAARRVTLLKAPELLTVNLAVTDIGMALSMYPLSISSAFNHAWIGGDTTCLYYSLMGMIFSITSIMTLAVMGMVRYLVTGSPPKTGSVSLEGIRTVLNDYQLASRNRCLEEAINLI